ncbi:MAG: nucleoside-diphosphate kinase, partial [Chloroflexota bacterium]
GLVQFITSGPAVAGVIQGSNAIQVVRTTMGATNPVAAAPGTIRGDLALDLDRNIIHGSDSPESAAREIALFFQPSELVGAATER